MHPCSREVTCHGLDVIGQIGGVLDLTLFCLKIAVVDHAAVH